MTDISLKNISSGYNLSKINDNFSEIQKNINDTSIQSEDGNNVMRQDFDMNSNRIMNVQAPLAPTDVVRLKDISVDGITAALFSKEVIVPVEGQRIYTIEADITTSSVVFINGAMQHYTDNSYSVNTDNHTIEFSEDLRESDVVEVWTTPLAPEPDTPTPVQEADFLIFDTVEEALASPLLREGQLVNIKEAVTSDKSLTFWDVVLASSLPEDTPDVWTPRLATTVTSLAIVLRGSDNWVFNLSNRPIELIAHRGAATAAPENTLLSMTNAINKGFESLEIDVQPSLDGTFWAFHDPNLFPDTDLSGAIAETSDAILETAQVAANNSTRFDGMGLSKFEDILKFAAGRRLKIYPEMKFYGWTDAAVEAFITLLGEYNYLNDNCMIQAVDTSLLVKVRELNKDVLIAAALDLNFEGAQPSIDLMAGLGNGALIWDHTKLLNEQELFFPYCFSRGVRLVAFTLKNTTLVEYLHKLGCYQIITDTYLGDNL